MEKKFIDIAPVNFIEKGFSCSESIAQTAVDLGIADESFVSVATSFSGGMSKRCLCGAVAGSQMVLGLLHGKYKDNIARDLAKEFYERFTKIHKVTCCKVISSGFSEFHSPERKKFCVNIVADCAKILDEMLSEIEQKV